METTSRIMVAGATGLVGSALVRTLRRRGYSRLLTPSRAELDLTRQTDTEAYFEANRPEYVFVAAAKVGGIHANSTLPADFIGQNLSIAVNVLTSAHRFGTAKILYPGSSCIYPRDAAQPITEEALMTGPLEPTNEAYAIAKIAGMVYCRALARQHGVNAIPVMPTSLYGPGDNFHPEHSHVIPALIRRFHEAKITGAPRVVIWGTGSPLREFMHVDDLGDSLVFLMERYDEPEVINVGSGQEVSIRELAELLKSITGYQGEIVFDASKPDGTPRKRLDTTRLDRLGWRPTIDLETGLAQTYTWFLENRGTRRVPWDISKE